MRKPPPRPAASPPPEGEWKPPANSAFDSETTQPIPPPQPLKPLPPLAAKIDKVGPIYATAFVFIMIAVVTIAFFIRFIMWLF